MADMSTTTTTKGWAPPDMGRVLRAYDRASLATSWRRDPASLTVRAVDDNTWEETVATDEAEQADYYLWKREAEVELDKYEEGVRTRARKSNHPTPTAALAGIKRPRKAKAKAQVVVYRPRVPPPPPQGKDGGGGGGGGGDGLSPKDKGEANE